MLRIRSSKLPGSDFRDRLVPTVLVAFEKLLLDGQSDAL